MTFGATMARSATFSGRCAIWLRFRSSWPWCEPGMEPEAPCATMRVKCTDTSGGARAIISTSTVGLPGGTRKPMRTGLLRGSTLALRLGAELLQHAGDFVDSGLDAGLVLLPARRARGAGRADGLLADPDR